MNTQIFNIHALTPAQTYALAKALENGTVAVFATDTVYGLGTGAQDELAVQKIYTLKNRPTTQPLQLLVAGLEEAQQVAVFPHGAKRVAQLYWPGGLTLILPPTPAGRSLLRGSTGLGLRVPAFGPLRQILALMNIPLACTSANAHNQPVLTHEDEVVRAFNTRVDYILLGGTLSPTASSVLDGTVTPPKILREGSIAAQDLLKTWRNIPR